jgi:hypothetical protein
MQLSFDLHNTVVELEINALTTEDVENTILYIYALWTIFLSKCSAVPLILLFSPSD